MRLLLWCTPSAVRPTFHVRELHRANDIGRLLFFCSRTKDLFQGKLVHDFIIRNSLEQKAHLWNLLLDLYGQCAALPEAFLLFETGRHPRGFNSWNSVVRTYARHGSFTEAMHLFGGMCREGVLLDKLTIISILSSATRHGALQEGRFVHSLVAEGDLRDDVFVDTALINMHGKCGNLLDAWFVFNNLQSRDTTAWNTMIAVFAQSEEQKIGALTVFNQMLLEGVGTDGATLVNVLSSCSLKADLLEGLKFHIAVTETGLDGELVVATAVLTMYGKCSDPKRTRRMFDSFHKHDVVSWNAMIGAYSVDGQKIEALQLFEKMLKEGLRPDKITFLNILEAFSGEEDLLAGKNMHICIIRYGLALDVVLGTSLINMYGRCGSPENAWILFNKMLARNAFTWNSMIAAYAQNSQGICAIQLLKKMQEKGFKPDRFTLLSIAKSCATECRIDDICSDILTTGVGMDDVAGSAFIYLYSKCGNLTMALSVFDQCSQESLILANAMIAAFGRNKEGRRALQLFKQVQLQAILPDKESYVHVLDAFENEGVLLGAKQVHACIAAANLESDNIVGTALVNMYIRCSGLEGALTWFENRNVQDVIPWTSLITACCQHERFIDALDLFERMQKDGLQPDRVAFVCILSACTNPATLSYGKRLHTLIVHSGQDSNVVMANALLNMYFRCGCLEDSLTMFKKIKFGDSVTYASVLSVCANWALLQKGREIHASIMGTEIESEFLVGNAVINFYGRCGCLKEAQLMFDRMGQRDSVTWTVIVAAYAQHGKGRAVLYFFNKMMDAGVLPNEITYVNVLSACCHDGLLHEACHYFHVMKLAIDAQPLVHHYDCLVDLFARAGRLEEAEILVKGMPFPATTVSWTTLLSACKGQVDIQRGKFAAEQVSHLDPGNYTPFLILRNIFSAAGNLFDSMIVE